MKPATILVFLLLAPACTYTVTDDGRLGDIIARQDSLERRQDALESRLSTQGEQLLQLNRRGVR